jgi:oxygen-independent coproporphyrinogen-3 oxidase
MTVALYLHIPSPPWESPHTAEALVTTLAEEAAHYGTSPVAEAAVETLYIGGGRPSALPIPALRRLLGACRASFDTGAVREVTLELHPNDASPTLLDALAPLGITRLSVGAPSPAAADTDALPAWMRSIRRVRAAGRRLSVDLALPPTHPARTAWNARLHRIVDLRVPHVALHERPSAATDERADARAADRLAFAMRFLAAKGYQPYTLTHFARPGHRSYYQTHTYAHGNILGLGPGAESFWWPSRDAPSTARRWSNANAPAAYVSQSQTGFPPVAAHDPLDRRALAREYLLLRLRTAKGLDLDVLAHRYDTALHRRASAALGRLRAEGLIHDVPDRVRLTPRGRLLTDAITRRLMRRT